MSRCFNILLSMVSTIVPLPSGWLERPTIVCVEWDIKLYTLIHFGLHMHKYMQRF